VRKTGKSQQLKLIWEILQTTETEL